MTRNVEPCPSALSTWIVAAVQRTSSRTSARPMPLPSKLRPPRAVDAMEALEEARQLVRPAMPVPVSRDRQHRRRRRRAAGATAMPPSSVNLNAFESRLRTIFSHISRSTYDRLGRAAGSRR